MLNRITSSDKRVTGMKDKIRYSDKAPGKGTIMSMFHVYIYKHNNYYILGVHVLFI